MFRRISRIPGQLIGSNPFSGHIIPGRVRLFQPRSGRPSLPFPHPWNFEEPIRILETFFSGTDSIEGSARHNRYLDVPPFHPVLVTRDPGVIRAITTDTGDRPGQFDRDPLPSTGIAKATGPDTLLYANGSIWKRQRKLAASPFGKTTLFQPEKFQEFETTFRSTVAQRLDALRQHLEQTGQTSLEICLEPEIKAVMLELLSNNFFGAEIEYDEIRNRHVPALERVIDHIVRDTILNKIGLSIWKLPAWSQRIRRAHEDNAAFENLTDRVLEARQHGRGLWGQFKSEAPDELLRSNIKVFLAGALEATTSYASWAISHLARNPEAQEKVFAEIAHIEDYTPENLGRARYFSCVLEETLRLTPSLYFLPRRATTETRVETPDGRSMVIPNGTHILLDVWHANRNDDFWGVKATGFPADEFHAERWMRMQEEGRASKDTLHFGFGHGPRVCPGKHLGQLEVGLVVGALIKIFRLTAPRAENPVKAGVSTKPADGTLVTLEPRLPSTADADPSDATSIKN